MTIAVEEVLIGWSTAAVGCCYCVVDGVLRLGPHSWPRLRRPNTSFGAARAHPRPLPPLLRRPRRRHLRPLRLSLPLTTPQPLHLHRLHPLRRPRTLVKQRRI